VVELEILRRLGDLLADRLQPVEFDGGDAARLLARRDRRPAHLPSSQSALFGL
jgi:hypothetical protein